MNQYDRQLLDLALCYLLIGMPDQMIIDDLACEYIRKYHQIPYGGGIKHTVMNCNMCPLIELWNPKGIIADPGTRTWCAENSNPYIKLRRTENDLLIIVIREFCDQKFEQLKQEIKASEIQR